MSVSEKKRRFYLPIHFFYRVDDDEPHVWSLGMDASTSLRWLIKCLSSPGCCSHADAKVWWCEWRDKGTKTSMLLYAHEGGMLGGKPESEAVLDMAVGDVFSTGATEFDGHVELRAWY